MLGCSSSAACGWAEAGTRRTRLGVWRNGEGGAGAAGAGGGGAIAGGEGGVGGASCADAEPVFSGTSILSPSRSQKSGAALPPCEQSTTHSRCWPVAGSRRVTFTRARSEETSTSLDWRRTGRSQKGV